MTDPLAALLEAVGRDFWTYAPVPGRIDMRQMTFDYPAYAARLRAAGVTLAAPAEGLDVERWARAQDRVIATTSYDATHVRVLSDAVAREYAALEAGETT